MKRKLFKVYEKDYTIVDSWLAYSPSHKAFKVTWPWFGGSTGFEVNWKRKGLPKVYRLAGWREFVLPKGQTHAIENGPPRDPVTGFPVGMPVNWQDSPINERKKP